MGKESLRKPLFVLLLAAMFMAVSFPCALTAGGTALAQSTFNDIADQPAEIQQAIADSCTAGYMQGFGDGGFHPNDATTRLHASILMAGRFAEAT